MNKIYLVGDTHGNWFNIQQLPPLDNDFVVVLGDFGFVWGDDASNKNLAALQPFFAATNSTLLFIDGNHENFDLLETMPVINKFGGKVHFINDNIFHLMRGQVFDLLGNKVFTMGGAVSIDKERRAEFISWWKQENISHADVNEAFENLDKVNWSVDYVFTHTAPKYVVDQLHGDHNSGFITDYNTKILQEFDSRLTYKHWYFGHHHTDRTIGSFTVLYRDKVELGHTLKGH